VSWINPNGGDWNTPSNWNTGALPTADQDVFLDIDVTNPITHSAGATQVKSLISTQRLTLSGGTLIITGTLQADNLVSFTGGSVVTTGDQIYNGAWCSGEHDALGQQHHVQQHGELRRTARSLTVNSNNAPSPWGRGRHHECTFAPVGDGERHRRQRN